MPPSAVHASILAVIDTGLDRAVTALPADLQRRVSIERGVEVRLELASSIPLAGRRTPDLTLRVKGDAEITHPKLAFEVGVSRSYKQLKEDSELMLRGERNIACVFLINCSESPQYSNPIFAASSDSLFDQSAIGINEFAL
jgi:hypothetical protein